MVAVPSRHITMAGDDELMEFISTPVGYVTTLMARETNDGSEFEWHDAQALWLSMDGHRVMNKCRQMGGSTILAAGEFAHAQLINDDFAHIFFSITKDEAQNKVAYVKEFMHSLPLRYRREIVYETKQAVEFKNSNGTTSKIISHAQRPSRGLHGNYNFDEADYYDDFPKLYNAALPGTRKVGGSINVISTPSDPAGLFREMLMGTDGTRSSEGTLNEKFKNMSRMIVNWWVIPFYSKNVEEAARLAPNMSTRERVERYGKYPIISALEDSRSLEVFQQEYECKFLEEDSRFLSYDSVKAAAFRNYSEVVEEDQSLHWNQEVDLSLVENDTKNYMFPMERFLVENRVSLNTYNNPKDISDLTSIEDLKRAYSNGLIKGHLIGGMDIATTGHATDITICEEVMINGKYQLIERFYVSKNKWNLQDQQEWVRTNILNVLPMRKFGIDTNGLGMQIGQELYASHPNIVEEMPTRVANQDRMFYALKELLDANRLSLSSEKSRIDSLYSIRRTILGNSSRWTINKTNSGHSDSAISLGICAALFLEHYRGETSTSRPFESFKEFIPYEKPMLEMGAMASVKSHNNRAHFSASRARHRGNHDLARLIDKTRIK